MESTIGQLKNAPIVEFILDIDCDLPVSQSLDELTEAAEKCFRARYPKPRKQVLQQFEITTKPGATPQATISPQRVQAYQFLTDDDKQLVQLRREGYSFNRLQPYTMLSDYLPEIEQSWADYRNLMLPLKIREVRLRYINRILLPMKDDKCNLSEYLVSAPLLPDEGRLALTGFVAHRTAVEVKTGHTVNIIQAAQKPGKDFLPIILDIGCRSTDTGAPDDWAWLTSQIMILNNLSNLVFQKSVTSSCMSLFQ
jgi:uncharacterized protein (TIGR04255 family)